MDYNDSELVSQSLSGNRDAFGRIVGQYQSLICSMAYSRTGDLAQSEDLAQETFLIAWKQLRQLREPEKLRSWLCSIARSVISGSRRRETRKPMHGAEPLDNARDAFASDPVPLERAINREEEASFGVLSNRYRRFIANPWSFSTANNNLLRRSPRNWSWERTR